MAGGVLGCPRYGALVGAQGIIGATQLEQHGAYAEVRQSAVIGQCGRFRVPLESILGPAGSSAR